MSDPAVEAAKNTWTGFAGGMFAATDPEYLGLLAASREVLKPIRELYGRLDAVLQKFRDWDFEDRWGHGIEEVLDALAPLIFSTEELKR